MNYKALFEKKQQEWFDYFYKTCQNYVEEQRKKGSLSGLQLEIVQNQKNFLG